MKFSKTLAHTTAIILLGTSVVHAETNWDMDAEGSIEKLPESGTVTLTGTVSSIRDEDTFSIEDATGNSIDVHSTTPLTLSEGTRVKVQGQMSDEVLGMGEEINSANVEILGENRAAMQGRTGVNAGAAGVDVGVGATADAEGQMPVSPKTAGKYAGTETSATARRDLATNSNVKDNYDADVDMDVDLEKQPKAEAQAKIEERQSHATARRDQPTNTNLEDDYDVRADVDADVDNVAAADTNWDSEADDVVPLDSDGEVRADAGEFSTFENLPKQGRIALSGTVARVNNDKKFTLRDSAGETIDVNTASSIAINKGDRVKVTGQVKPEFLGLGQEVEATDVVRVNTDR